MDKVATYTVDKPVAVIVKGKEPVQGTLELKPSGDWRLKANGQQQTVSAASAETIMPADTYQKLVVVSPKPWQAWKGSASLGESIQHGNQQTTHSRPPSMQCASVRKHPFPGTYANQFWFMTLLSHASQDNSTITSHTFSSNLREDFLFTPDNFVFGMAQLDHISTEGLYLRQTYGGGFGRDVIKKPRTTFSLIGGLTAQHEKFFTGAQDENLFGLVGETLGEQISKRIRFDQGFNFYPNFTEGGQYRFDTSATLSIKLFNKFSFTTSAIDLFLSNPPPGNERNNITLSTGIGYTF